MRLRHEVLLNFVSYGLSRVVSLAVFGFTIPLALNALGAERFAVFSVIMQILNFVPLLDAGIGYALTFRYSRSLQRNSLLLGRLVSEHFWLYLALALLFTALFVPGFPLIFLSQQQDFALDELGMISVGGGLAIFFLLLSIVARATLVSHKKTYVLNGLDIGTDVLRGIALYVGVMLMSNLGWTVFLTAMAYAVRSVVMGIFSRQLEPRPLESFRFIRMRSLRASIGLGAPFAVSALSFIAIGVLDRAAIARFCSLAELASYSIAYDVVARGWLIMYAVNGAIAPILMRWGHARETNNLSLAMKYSWLLTISVIILVYGVLNLFEPMLIGWWLGAEMAISARLPIALLSVASAFYLCTCVLHNFFQATGQTALIGKAYFIGLLVYLPTLFLGIFQIGIAGAAMAHILFWATVLFIMLYWTGKNKHQLIGKVVGE